MDYGQLGHASEEFLAIQIADGLQSDTGIRPAFDGYRDARGQGRTGATLNGKKARIRRSDFEKSIIASGVNEKVLDNIAKKFRKALMKWIELIEASFLPDDFKRQYKRLILKRMLMLR